MLVCCSRRCCIRCRSSTLGTARSKPRSGPNCCPLHSDTVLSVAEASVGFAFSGTSCLQVFSRTLISVWTKGNRRFCFSPWAFSRVVTRRVWFVRSLRHSCRRPVLLQHQRPVLSWRCGCDTLSPVDIRGFLRSRPMPGCPSALDSSHRTTLTRLDALRLLGALPVILTSISSPRRRLPRSFLASCGLFWSASLPARAPVFATQQQVPIFAKELFSMCTDEVMAHVDSLPNKPKNVVLFGIEAHVCVTQVRASGARRLHRILSAPLLDCPQDDLSLRPLDRIGSRRRKRWLS